MRTLSIAELNELLEEVETAIRRYSEELVQQLALRDELDFEKEVKNSFISILIDVQNRQKEHRELLRKKKKLKAAGAVSTPPGRSERTLGPGTVSLQANMTGQNLTEWLSRRCAFHAPGLPVSLSPLLTFVCLHHK